MTPRRHLGLALAALVAAFFAMLGIGADPAKADYQLPFKDPAAQGTLGLCDRSGHNITSGKITDVPFVWRVVSSKPAPKGYTGTFAKATLFVYQPREKVDPGQWSGKQMTGSSTFTRSVHPAAQATNLDPSLIEFTSIAPLWNGLVQLRVIYSNVNTTPHTRPYPATVIQVTGNSWHVVSGGNVSCSTGAAISMEQQLLDPSAFPSASPTLLNPAGGTPSSLVTQDPVSGGATPDPGSLPGTGGSQVAAQASRSVLGVNPVSVAGLLALLAVAAGIVWLLARRQALPLGFPGAQPTGRREAGAKPPSTGSSGGSHARG